MRAYQKDPDIILGNKGETKKEKSPLGSIKNPYASKGKAENGRNTPAYYYYSGNKNDLRELKR
jgi:hypothetical protein